jgi:hypothetical protein
MKKKLPKLQTDEEAEEFVANADLVCACPKYCSMP